jgi:hypothetical protein
MNDTTNSPAAQPQEAPERIWIYGGPKYGRMIAYTNPARWVGSLQPTSGYTEYVRADLPRATADGPATTYKDKRRLTDEERFRWRKVYNDYTFSNCDHEHGGYPNHLVCAECAFELMDHFTAAPRATGETTVEACLAELRIMFPSRWVEVISGLNAVGGEYYFVRVYGLTRRSSCSSLDEAMAQVRATRTEGEGK